MNLTYRAYDVDVEFKNDGVVYGTERYRVLATNADQAERKAYTNATGSQFNDDRHAGRSINVGAAVEA